MSIEHTVAVFEQQAVACAELGSPLYAALLHAAAADVREGGPCAAAVAYHEDDAGPQAVALRLLGGVHALVLTGRAPELAAHYPSAAAASTPRGPTPPGPHSGRPSPTTCRGYGTG
ncbi:DUF2332 family protein [Kitasatospora arboriphila]